MGYTAHAWVDEEVITEQKMNHLENGVAAAITEEDVITTVMIDAICNDNEQNS